ncbi:MarR family transcriptional regulator [Bradyrhizobium jicamae]|nr:MarR family transcriptional regulator [Bradyrhizobium jicamae]
MYTPSDLTEQTGLTSGAITGVIDRLVREGYVVRERDDVDRRKLLPETTERVQIEAAPLAQVMRKAVDAVLEAQHAGALTTTLVVLTDLLELRERRFGSWR